MWLKSPNLTGFKPHPPSNLMGYKPLTTPITSKGNLGSPSYSKYFIHLSLIPLDIIRIARAPFSSQDKYIIKRQRTPNPQQSLAEKETEKKLIGHRGKILNKRKQKQVAFTLTMTLVATTLGSLQTDSMKNTCKAQQSSAKSQQQGLEHSASSCSTQTSSQLHPRSIPFTSLSFLSNPRTQGQERSPIPAAKSPLQHSIMRTTHQ